MNDQDVEIERREPYYEEYVRLVPIPRLVVDTAHKNPAADTFIFTLKCTRILDFSTTRIAFGRDFDEAMDRSLRAEPEENFIIAAAARWNRKAQRWERFQVPQYEGG